jgi:hypothetical protein
MEAEYLLMEKLDEQDGAEYLRMEELEHEQKLERERKDEAEYLEYLEGVSGQIYFEVLGGVSVT